MDNRQEIAFLRSKIATLKILLNQWEGTLRQLEASPTATYGNLTHDSSIHHAETQITLIKADLASREASLDRLMLLDDSDTTIH